MKERKNIIRDPYKLFNQTVASLPLSEATPRWAKIYNKLIDQGDANLALKIDDKKTLVRNVLAESIANGREVNITFSEILKEATPKEYKKQSISEIINWRKNTWNNLFGTDLLSEAQKEKLRWDGIKYFPDGTIDLTDFAYEGMIVDAKSNKFSICDGELNRRSDKRHARKKLKLRGMEIHVDCHLHHQITKGIKQLIVVPKSLHDTVPHIGYSRFEKLDYLKINR
jgi:hypothetical protein